MRRFFWAPKNLYFNWWLRKYFQSFFFLSQPLALGKRCIFVLIFYVPVNNFSIMLGCAFLGWTSTKQRIKCLAQVPPMRLEPATIGSRVTYSNTEPLHSPLHSFKLCRLKFKISQNIEFLSSNLKTCSMPLKNINYKWTGQLSFDKLEINQSKYYILPNSGFWGQQAPKSWIKKWTATCDFHQCGILTSVDSDKPLQPPFKLRNSNAVRSVP